MESIKINNDRMKKREREHIQAQYNNLTPPKYRYKQSKYNLMPKYQKDMGYDFKVIGQQSVYSKNRAIHPTQDMKWEKQQFNYALDKLLGKHVITKKMTGKDKWKLKQELGIDIAPSKMKVWGRIERLVDRQLLMTGFESILRSAK